MTDYNFGDIILVPFPFTDQSTTKKRPAVVVSSKKYNQSRPDLVLMAVTLRIETILIRSFQSIVQEAGLLI